MEHIQAPKLARKNPESAVAHAAQLLSDFNAVNEYVEKTFERYVQDPRPALKQRIAKDLLGELGSALNEVPENIRRSVEGQLTEEVVHSTVSNSFPTNQKSRVPKFLFDELHRSMMELNAKLAPQQGVDSSSELQTFHLAEPSQTMLAPRSINYVYSEGVIASQIEEESNRFEQPIPQWPWKNSSARLDTEKADQEQKDQEVDRCCVCNSSTEAEELITTTCCRKVVGSLCFEENLDETGECVLCQKERRPQETSNSALSSRGDGQYLEHFVEQVCSQSLAEDDGYEAPPEKLTASFFLRLFDQRVINLLRDKNPQELLKVLHEALEEDPSRIHLCPRIGWLSHASQIESGDVEVFVKHKVVENLKHVNGNTSWAQTLETQIIAGLPSYKVEMRFYKDNSPCLTDPLRNSKAIMELVGLDNATFIESLDRPDDIYEMRYLRVDTNGRRQGFKVLIAFSNARQANEAIRQGLWCNGKLCPCRKPKSLCLTKFQQCMRCQEIGHSEPDCTSPVRCQICAEPHWESECVATKYRCALCGRAHGAQNGKKCPQIKAEKGRLQSLNSFYYDEEGEIISTGSAKFKNSPAPATSNFSPTEKTSDISSKNYTSVKEFNHSERAKHHKREARLSKSKAKPRK